VYGNISETLIESPMIASITFDLYVSFDLTVHRIELKHSLMLFCMLWFRSKESGALERGRS
jgi:hypothetical protein